MSTVVIAECKEPWLFWWLLRPTGERQTFIKKHYPTHLYIKEVEIKAIWEVENLGLMEDEDWLKLAGMALDSSPYLTKEQKDEIWCQVYRIASERI